ncbi:hypothetical protein BN1723_000197 [Verticillium longisporum]|uniref:CASTOR ACT domain-containing protein n=1 Tax=Verticillium longisporum TaxID=100787 RepID=A0A0G4KEP3_VERLO|nr:hypothetical protein BN1723_000197 [Verticillium longisporum]
MVAPNVLITILPGEYSLIHFPPMLYTHFLHPVLQALLPQSQTISPDDARETPPWPQHSLPGLTEDHQHNFLNVSVTPLEASVVCHADWARTVFRPAIDRILETLPSHVRKPAVLSPDTYLVLSVISGGGGGADTDIVARILDLTAPLALAGIPIFFISTYYSDFILVPAKDRATVLAALTARGFQCPADHGNRFVASRPGGSGSGLAASSTPTPESPADADAATLATLFDRTFAQLKTRNVVPSVDPTLRLVQLSARETPLPNRGSPTSFSLPGLGSRQTTSSTSSRRAPPPTWLDTSDARLYASVVSALVACPRFFSLTLAVDDPPSLLLDRALVPLFGDTLVGSADEELVATRNVVPSVDPTLRLVQLSARETPLPNHGSPTSFSRPGLGSRQTTSSTSSRRAPPPTWLDTSDARLYASVVSALVARPRFFSLTLAVDDPPSLLLDRALVPLFGDTLVGSADEELVAVSLDLAGLPLEATGIVCGVAGRLVQDPVIAGHGLSYLSTAFAGTVVLAPEQARRAVEILEPLLR